MPPVTSSTLVRQTSKTLCYYFNSTQKIQLIRLWNGRSYGLEKIVFPQPRILFEAKPENILEVHTQQQGEHLLKLVFACDNLQVNRNPPQLAVG